MSSIIEPGQKFKEFRVGQRVKVVNDSTYKDVTGYISAFGNCGMVLISPDEGTPKNLYWIKESDERRTKEVGYATRILYAWLNLNQIIPIETKIDSDGNLV